MEAEWKTIRFRANPTKVAREIEAIGGDATPEQIVEKARDERTELHKCFVWDDTIAAENWRRHMARILVCNIVIKREPNETEDVPRVRWFEKTTVNEGYKPVTVIVKREDEYKALLQRAWNELHAFKKRYSTLTELEEILELIP